MFLYLNVVQRHARRLHGHGNRSIERVYREN